jgi:hypothetical protein
MRQQEPDKIALPLRDLHDLFTVPEFVAADNRIGGKATATDTVEEELDELYEPGIDSLVSRLRGRQLSRRGQLVLALPTATVQPDLAILARRAIDRYCRHKILESKRTLNELLWIGVKALQVGVLFLASCLVLAGAIARSYVEAGSFGDILTQGLTIVGWVSLWRPIEILLYEWWPLWRDVRVYDYILRMDIAIQSRGDTRSKGVS